MCSFVMDSTSFSFFFLETGSSIVLPQCYRCDYCSPEKINPWFLIKLSLKRGYYYCNSRKTFQVIRLILVHKNIFPLTSISSCKKAGV